MYKTPFGISIYNKITDTNLNLAIICTILKITFIICYKKKHVVNDIFTINLSKKDENFIK